VEEVDLTPTSLTSSKPLSLSPNEDFDAEWRRWSQSRKLQRSSRDERSETARSAPCQNEIGRLARRFGWGAEMYGNSVLGAFSEIFGEAIGESKCFNR
jgi:hypothetical protein